jgi:hypothetical protein
VKRFSRNNQPGKVSHRIKRISDIAILMTVFLSLGLTGPGAVAGEVPATKVTQEDKPVPTQPVLQTSSRPSIHIQSLRMVSKCSN